MTNQDLANLIFPDVKHDIHYYEEKYPKRNLKEGQVVTRVAPSPTGYMHLGTLFQAIIDYILVKNRGGVFYDAIQKTDGTPAGGCHGAGNAHGLWWQWWGKAVAYRERTLSGGNQCGAE